MLIDDNSDPPLRTLIGRLLATHSHAEIAVASIRIAALDLAAHETLQIERWRILLGRLEAGSLMRPAMRPTAAAHDDDIRLQSLVRLLESGHLEIRSAGLAAWTPDFSLYRSSSGQSLPASMHAAPVAPHPDACLIGAHWFHEPVIADGPSFTVLLTDPPSVARALARFETLWERSHDVLEPVLTAVRRRQPFSAA